MTPKRKGPSDPKLHDAIRVAKILNCSEANGPGRRFVLWVQGCGLKCPGCCNPKFQSFSGGDLVDWTVLSEKISQGAKKMGVLGLTITGGEPMLQPVLLRRLIWSVRGYPDDKKTHITSVLMFTGYTEEEVGPWISQSEHAELWREVDIIVSGRYVKELKIEKPHSLLASSNQKLYFPTRKFSEKDLGDIPVGEIIIPKDGKKAIVTGMTPGVLD